MYIAIEGVDGSGKSTLIENLKKEFPQVTFVREPGTSKFAEDIRSAIFNNFKDISPMAIQLAMLSARADLKVYIEGQQNVISDRCFISGCYCEELQDKKDISDWISLSMKYIKVPDLIIYLDISAETSIQRLSTRNKMEAYDTLKKGEIENRIKSYKKWLEVAKNFYVRFVCVDANKSQEEVTNEVVKLIYDYGREDLCKEILHS